MTIGIKIEPRVDVRFLVRSIRHEPAITDGTLCGIWVGNRHVAVARDERVANVLVAALQVLAVELWANNEVSLADLLVPLHDLTPEGRIANEFGAALIEEVAADLTELHES